MRLRNTRQLLRAARPQVIAPSSSGSSERGERRAGEERGPRVLHASALPHPHSFSSGSPWSRGVPRRR